MYRWICLGQQTNGSLPIQGVGGGSQQLLVMYYMVTHRIWIGASSELFWKRHWSLGLHRRNFLARWLAAENHRFTEIRITKLLPHEVSNEAHIYGLPCFRTRGRSTKVKAKMILRPTVSRSVGQSVLVSGTYLEPINEFSFFLIVFRQLRVYSCGTPNVARGRICS
jgi:hypothetical protein